MRLALNGYIVGATHDVDPHFFADSVFNAIDTDAIYRALVTAHNPTASAAPEEIVGMRDSRVPDGGPVIIDAALGHGPARGAGEGAEPDAFLAGLTVGHFVGSPPDGYIVSWTQGSGDPEVGGDVEPDPLLTDAASLAGGIIVRSGNAYPDFTIHLGNSRDPDVSHVFSIEPGPFSLDEASAVMHLPLASNEDDTVIAHERIDPHATLHIRGVLGPQYVEIANLTEHRMDVVISKENSEGTPPPPSAPTVFTFTDLDQPASAVGSEDDGVGVVQIHQQHSWML